MITHLSTEQIEEYVGRRSSLADLARVNEHLFGCEACYQRFLDIFQRRRFPVVIDLDELTGLKGWHLQGEELKDYVQGRMEGLHLDHANLHLKACAWCREEVSHFSEFTDKLEYYLSKRHVPLKQSVNRSKQLPKIGAIFIPWSPVRLASAAAFIVLLLISATLIWSVLGINPREQGATAHESSNVGSSVRADGQSAIQAPTNPPEHPETSQPDTSTQPGDALNPKYNPQGTISSATSRYTSRDKRKSEKARQDAETSLVAENLVMPAVIEMFDRAPVVLRGDGNKNERFRVASPYSTVISDDRPTFRWTALTGASSYVVSVYDAKLNLIKTSEPLTNTQWVMPSQLKRGQVYTWVVTALKDGKEVLAPTLPARAEFKIIEQPEWAKLRNLIKNTQSGVARGILYAKAGLLDEAEQEIQAHLALRPIDKTAKKLLQTIKSWREI
jgi:hypothetical protein